MENTRPVNYQLFGDFLAFSWADGHESMLSLKMLREGCPCAHCRGEPDLLGRMLKPADSQSYNDGSFALIGMQPVGQYGLQLIWGDSHSTGIYTFDYLRRLCDCDSCRKTRQSAGP